MSLILPNFLDKLTGFRKNEHTHREPIHSRKRTEPFKKTLPPSTSRTGSSTPCTGSTITTTATPPTLSAPVGTTPSGRARSRRRTGTCCTRTGSSGCRGRAIISTFLGDFWVYYQLHLQPSCQIIVLFDCQKVSILKTKKTISSFGTFTYLSSKERE